MTLVENSQKITSEEPHHPLNEILHKFLHSAINIAPDALFLLYKINLTTNDLENFIQKISFSSNFNSYVTTETIKQEFAPYFNQDASKGNIFVKPILMQDFQAKGYGKSNNACESDSIPSSDIGPPLLTKEQNSKDLRPQDIKNPSIQDIKQEKSNELAIPILEQIPPPIPQKNGLNGKNESPSLENNPETQKIEKNPSGSNGIPSPLPKKLKKIKKKRSTDNEDEDSEEEESDEFEDDESEDEIETPEDLAEIARIREEKRKLWEKLDLHSPSTTFHPIASEYDTRVTVLKDPTGNLYAEGKIEEFQSLQLDKFKNLKRILTQRPEGTSLLEISHLNNLQNSTEVKFIGMVVDKRQTVNKNYIIEFEDLSGTISVLVKPDSNKKELYNLMRVLLPDHVCIVAGYLNINVERKSRIVIANEIVFPDAPFTHETSYPEDDIAICMISDIHIGSKDWMGKVWEKFVNYLNCRIGSENQIKQAGKVKYLSIAGDLVDGIGVYPNQETRLSILDIYRQYDAVAEELAKLPDHIKVIISPGDHDAVRKAIPTPAIPREFGQKVENAGALMVGCPTLVSLHGIKTLIFHGTSLIDMNMSIPGLKNEDPVGTMRELVRARHLAPTYGKKTELAPTEKDWLVIDPLPDILHTGHLHKNGCNWINKVLAVNSGCFQAQTDYMKSFGIDPDIGKLTIVNCKAPALRFKIIDLFET